MRVSSLGSGTLKEREADHRGAYSPLRPTASRWSVRSAQDGPRLHSRMGDVQSLECVGRGRMEGTGRHIPLCGAQDEGRAGNRGSGSDVRIPKCCGKPPAARPAPAPPSRSSGAPRTRQSPPARTTVRDFRDPITRFRAGAPTTRPGVASLGPIRPGSLSRRLIGLASARAWEPGGTRSTRRRGPGRWRGRDGGYPTRVDRIYAAAALLLAVRAGALATRHASTHDRGLRGASAGVGRGVGAGLTL